MSKRFNEWAEARAKSSDLGMETSTDTDLLESQLEQWINKLAGLLHSVPQDKKTKLLEKVISNIKQI